MKTVDEYIAILDGNGDGQVSKVEWLENLQKCVGLAHTIADHLDDQGNVSGLSAAPN